jgi:hypothetical protein
MVPMLAVFSVLACMVVKMFLALQTKAYEKKLAREREVLHAARVEQGKAAGKMKLLDAEDHQLNIKQKKIRQKVDRYTKTLNGYSEKEHKAKEKAQAQQEMMKAATEQK